MRRMLLVTVVLIFFHEMLAQNVGIGTNDPQAQLHVHGNQTGQGNVLFTGEYKSIPGHPPTSGPGTRMMWYPDNAAFRAGLVDGDQWDLPNLGAYSVALGFNVTASGFSSVAMGDQTSALGSYAFALGYGSEASGITSTAIGERAKAGNRAVAIGYNVEAFGFSSLALGGFTKSNNEYSTAMGKGSLANGAQSTSLGNYTIANAADGLALGAYNDPIVNQGFLSNANSPIFIIGNGNGENSRSNALVVRKSGRMGLDGANDPAYRLSLVDNNLGIDRPAANTMAFYTNGIERLRLTSNGRVGIGLTNPGAPLEVSNENAMIRITNPTGGTTGIEFLRSGGGDDWRLHNTGGLITLSRSTNDLGSVTDHYVFTQSAFRPAVDNTQTVGQGNFRWVSVHATNGTIQTSDARLKENIQPLNYGLQTISATAARKLPLERQSRRRRPPRFSGTGGAGTHTRSGTRCRQWPTAWYAV
jgi:trimeric autotransporter adhesin